MLHCGNPSSLNVAIEHRVRNCTPTVRYFRLRLKQKRTTLGSFTPSSVGVEMNKPSQPWWSPIRFGKSEPAADTDYGDMGTALGLDATVAPIDDPEAQSLAEELAANDRQRRRSI